MKLLLANAPVGLMRELVQRGHELLIANGSPYSEEFREFSSSSLVLLKGKKKVNLRAIRAMRTAIREFQPDIVHAFMPASLSQAILGSAGLRNRPKIVSFRGITRVPSRWDPSEWISYHSSAVNAHACESIAVMEAMVEGGVPESKCHVVYNCVTPWPPSNDDAARRAEIRDRYEIPHDAFVVGTVAGMRPVKGIDLLLLAAMDCVTTPNVYFLIVGEIQDPVVARLSEDSRLKERLRMVGYVDHAPKLVNAMDLFIMPSRKEGLCRALLEAMEQGVCPAVSDAGGMKEMVRDRVDGIVFPKENSQAIVDVIHQFHGDREALQRYGQSAQQRVRQMCYPSVFADRMEAIYRSI